MRRPLLALALVLALGSSAFALTSQQFTTLRTDINANTTPVPAGIPDCVSFVGQQIKNLPIGATAAEVCIAAFYNLDASPAFTVWRTNVPLAEVSNAFNQTELGGLTSLNTQRLQNYAAWYLTGANPSLQGTRDFFTNTFSGAGGSLTRPALDVVWRRLATRAERLYATGTGSNAVPGLLVFEGAISASDVNTARAN